MPTIGIAGGTGFTGKYITELLLQNGYEVIVFTRNSKLKSMIPGLRYAWYSPATSECDDAAFQSLDAAIHLSGAGIAEKRWSKERKQEIIDSRVTSTTFFLKQLKALSPQCKTFIAASAIGVYGPDRAGAGAFTETALPFTDFLADTTAAWEAASQKGAAFMRTIILRFGLVLGREGGAFPQLAQPLKFGIVPILGSGRQVMSWIHVEDIAGIALFALGHHEISGTYNAVSPNPVPHKQFMKTLAKAMGGIKIPVRAPAFLLKLILGELSIEPLKSCTVSSSKITSAGYHFKYSQINAAIDAIVNRPLK